jgi:hypothetical protein
VDASVAVGAEAAVTFEDCETLQPFASVTVTLYVPAPSAVIELPVLPLLHAYVYGAVPPVTLLTVTRPFVKPQVALVADSVAEDGPVVFETVALVETVQPLADVTVTV